MKYLYLCLTFISITFLAFGQNNTPTLSPDQRAALDATLSLYEVITIDIDELYARWSNIDQPVAVQLPTHEGMLAAELRNSRQISPDYIRQVNTEAGVVRVAGTDFRLLEGRVFGEYGGAARLTIGPEWLMGYWEKDGQQYYIEPLRQYDEAAPADQFVIYSTLDVIPQGNHTCAFTHTERRARQLRPEAPEVRVGLCWDVEVGLAGDWLLNQSQGGVTPAEGFMLSVLNAVQGNYDDEFADEINFVVVATFVPATAQADPWTNSTNSGTLLTSFRNWGNGGGFGVDFDVATLWSDRNFDGSTIGLASVGSVCTGSKYNVCERFSTNINLLRVLQAHELGHNFSSLHDAPGSGFIMAPSVNTSTTWSNTSQNSINSFVTAISNNCLSPCAPPVPPTPLIEASATMVCPGSYVAFADASLGSPTEWEWQFLGGVPETSNEANPTVYYETPGTYSVVLTATNANGSNTTVFNQDIIVADGFSKYLLYESFENGVSWATENPDGGITWNGAQVGGASFGTGAVFMNNFDYNSSGQVDAIVSPPVDLSTTSGAFLELDYAYRPYTNPASFNDRLRILVSTDFGQTFPNVVFDENANGLLPTGAPLGSAFVPNIPADWGNIQVDMTAFQGNQGVMIKIENTTGFGNNLYVDNVRVTVDCVPLVPPVALFSLDPSLGCAPLTVQFIDQSTGTIDTREWNFPGGTPSSSTEQNPVVTYNAPGLYNASLQVSNQAGVDVFVMTEAINVLGPPNAGFDHEVSGGQYTVAFTDESTGAQTIVWNFDDGSDPSGETNPIHEFPGPGTYEVRQIVTNPCGTDEIIKTIVLEAPLVADFTTSGDLTGCGPLTIEFMDNSVGMVTSYAWDFPGGMPESSDEANPTVTYDTPGTYTVTLTVNDGTNSSEVVQTDLVVVEPGPTAGFDAMTTLGELEVDFSDQSQNATSVSWDFGDGNTSDETDPSHTYMAEGEYTVTQIVSNDCGNDTTTQVITLLLPPSADFSVSLLNNCAPFTAQFMADATGDDLTYAWTFEGGDPMMADTETVSVNYATPGTYSVTLAVTNAAGTTTNTETDLIVVAGGPTAGFSFQQNGSSINFTNDSENADSYTWDFGDNTTSDAANPSHEYEESGTYTVQLIAINGCGADTLTQELTIDVNLPTAGFQADVTSGCAPLEVTFTNTSEGADEVSWEFTGGNPATSEEDNPTVVYDMPGTYTVKLVATNAAGSVVVSQVDYITVGGAPTAGFDWASNVTTVDFTSTSTDANTYAWDFAGQGSSMMANPSFTFDGAGTFPVTLIVSNDCGADTLTQNIEIVGLAPQAAFTQSIQEDCAPGMVAFMDSSEGDVTSYAWTFDGGTPASSSDPNPVVTYDQPGTYTATLTVTNAFGSTMTTGQEIVIQGLPDPSYEYVIFDALEFGFLPNMADADDLTFSWNFGDGNTSDVYNPTHTFSEQGIYNVSLEVTNDCGSAGFGTMIEVIIDGVDAPDWAEEVLLFPNPNRGQFSLRLKGALPDELHFELFNTIGQIIHQRTQVLTGTTYQEEFDFRDLPTGMYWLGITAPDGERFYRKVVVE